MIPQWLSFAFVWNVIRTFSAIFWLRANRWIVQTLLVKDRPATKTYHKIVVIGDGLAEGFGDHVILGRVAGVARFIREKLSQGFELKQNWEVFNLGHYGSTSEDWLPEATAPPPCFPHGVKQTLWKDLVGNSHFKDADIVVLMVGSMDRLWSSTPQDPQTTIDNIGKICDALTEMGKVVSVSTIPHDANNEEMPTENKKRNFLLRKYLNSMCSKKTDLQKENKGFVPGVIRGADLAALTSEPNPENFAYDGFHVRFPIYKLAAQRIYQEIFLEMVAVEWTSIKSQLASGFSGSS